MKIELAGEVFGRLTVQRLSHSQRGKRIWQCRCECDNTVFVPTEKLRSGHTKSCGCYGLEVRRAAVTTHGESKKTREYAVWSGIVKRCHNQNATNYKFYGAKGVTVCERWRRSYLDFLRDMGRCPSGYEIDRIDNRKGYEPSNCRWVPPIENKRNMSNNRRITREGVEKTIVEWCETLGIPPSTVYQRVHRGWPEADWFLPKNTRRKGIEVTG